MTDLVGILEKQKEILNMIAIYSDAEPQVIKDNISFLTKHRNNSLGYYHRDFAKALGVSVDTIRAWCKVGSANKPYFQMALKLADILEISILDFTKPIKNDGD